MPKDALLVQGLMPPVVRIPIWIIGLYLELESFKHLMTEDRTFLPFSLAFNGTSNEAKALNKERGREKELGRFSYFL